MTMQLYSRLTVRDVEGRIVRRGRWRRSHSFVKQFPQMLLCRMRSSGDVPATDIAGASRNMQRLGSGDGGFMNTGGILGVDAQGVVIGTGSTPVGVDDYALEAKIAHGTGGGQMEYGVGTFSSVSVAGGTASFTTVRSFVNSSGASITVNEYGMYTTVHDGGTWRYYLSARDLITGGQAVEHGQAITIEYRVSVTAGE